MRMLILYVLLVAYILAINFYAFLLVKGYKTQETETNDPTHVHDEGENSLKNQPLPVSSKTVPNAATAQNDASPNDTTQIAQKTPSERVTGKLCITGLLGGAITVYVCMFAFKYRRTDLLLMVLMPLLGVLNVYLFVLLFRAGFPMITLR